MPLPGRHLLAASVMACACVDGSTAATVPDSPWPPASSSSSAGTPPEGGDAVECEELAAPPDTVTPVTWALPALDLTDESCDSTRLDYSDCGAGCYEYYNSWETTVVDADGRTRWEEQDRYSPFRTSYIYDDAWRLTAAYVDEGAGSEVFTALAYGHTDEGWLAEERQQQADGSASAIVWWESDSEGREVWEGADRDVDGFLDYTRQTEWTTEGRTETAEQCSDGDRERYVFTFDASGNPLGVTCDYESDGVIDREEVWTRDAEGVLLWYESREAGVVHTRADYGYADGLLVTEHWVHGWGTSDIAYTYDAERRLIEYVRDGDSSTEHILYFYDADGWLSRADYVYPDSAGELQVSHTERYEYDSEGRPLAWELDWYLDGSAVEWMYWTYETVPC